MNKLTIFSQIKWIIKYKVMLHEWCPSRFSLTIIFISIEWGCIRLHCLLLFTNFVMFVIKHTVIEIGIRETFFNILDDIPIVESDSASHEDSGSGETSTLSSGLASFKSKSKIPHILSKIKRNSVVVITEEGDVETIASPPNANPNERKKSIDATAV